MQIPEFWRAEIWHPLSVHFPIALLLVAFLFKLISLFAKHGVWSRGGSILLYLGTLGAWIAVYTGDLADGVIARNLCDPTILKDHENAAYITGWLFSIAAVIDTSQFINLSALKKQLLNLTVALILLAGSGFLIYVGHSGATLVYQQGAGVYQPTEDCREFE